MAFPDKVLSNEEKVIEHLHPHWITLVPATLWFLVICAAGGLGIGYAPSSGTTHTVFVIVIIVVGAILLIWLAFSPWIKWRSSHFVITDHRVLIRRGVLRHSGRDIALQRITDVGFSQSLWDRIVKAGTLTIESASENGQETLENVPRSEQQQQLLNRLIESDGARRSGQAYGASGYGAPGYGAPGQPPPSGPMPGAPMPGAPMPGQPGYPTQQLPPQ
ncbi:MAG: PH domain-containing protein [Jatrophihabitantaceae bacterium]